MWVWQSSSQADQSVTWCTVTLVWAVSSHLGPNVTCRYLVQDLFGVCGWDAEAHSGFDDGRGWETHDDHSHVPLQHLSAEGSGETDTGNERHFRKEAEFSSGRKQIWFAAPKIQRSLSLNSHIIMAAGATGLPYLGRHVEHHGYNGRVLVAVDGEAHFTKPLTEIDGVLCQLANPLAAWEEHTQRKHT